MHEKVLSILDEDYRQWIVSLKKRYRQSQLKAAVKVKRGAYFVLLVAWPRYRHDETRGEMGSGLLRHAFQGSSAITSGCEGILGPQSTMYEAIL